MTWQLFWADTLGVGWQDYVIAIVQWVFFLTLIPAIRDPHQKPPVSTSVLTGTLLLVLAFTVSTMGLANSAFSSLAVAAAWFYLGLQRQRLNAKA